MLRAPQGPRPGTQAVEGTLEEKAALPGPAVPRHKSGAHAGRGGTWLR